MEISSLVTVRTLAGAVLLELEVGVWTVGDLTTHLMSLKPPGPGNQYQLVHGTQPLSPETMLEQFRGMEIIAIVYTMPTGKYEYSCSHELQPERGGKPKRKTESLCINLSSDGQICVVFTTEVAHLSPNEHGQVATKKFYWDRVAHGTWQSTGGRTTATLTRCEFFEAHPPGPSSVEPLQQTLEFNLTEAHDLRIQSSNLVEGRSMVVFGDEIVYKRLDSTSKQDMIFSLAAEKEPAGPRRGCCELL